MNTKKLLKNPLVVGILSVLAFSYIFLNNILPMMKKSDDNAMITETDPSVLIDDYTQPQTPDQVQTGLHPDSVQGNNLKSFGWKRAGGRDPFLDEIRSLKRNHAGDAVENTADESIDLSKRVTNAPTRPLRPLLKAIARGPSGRVALIGTRFYKEGDTCGLGVIGKIGKDSVFINNLSGPRILHF
jgi:hypothetical protein